MSDKTWAFSLNEVPIDQTTLLRQSQSFIYQLKERMKTAGWTVNQSSRTSLSSLPQSLRQHSMNLLPDGRLLVIGGYNGSSYLQSTYFGTISGDTINWVQGTNFPIITADHGSTILSDGRILVAGGWNGSTVISTTYFGTISGNTITWAAGTNMPNTGHTRRNRITAYPNNTVLFSAGTTTGFVKDNNARNYLASISGNIISYGTGTSIGATTYAPSQATLLLDGRILVSGGINSGATPSTTATTYFMTGASAIAGTNLPVATLNHSMTQLSDGRLLFITGNTTYFGTISGNTITWVVGSATPQSIGEHCAVKLPDGKVLVSGGFNSVSGTTLHNVESATVSANTIGWKSNTDQSDLWSDYSSISFNLTSYNRSYMVLTSPTGFVAGADGSYTGDDSKISVCLEAVSSQAHSSYNMNLTVYAGVPSYSSSVLTIPSGGQSMNLNGTQIIPSTLSLVTFNYGFTNKGGFWAGIGLNNTAIMTTILGVLELSDTQKYLSNDYGYAAIAFLNFNNTINNFTYSIFDSATNSNVKIFNKDGSSGTARAMILGNGGTPYVMPGYNTIGTGDVNGDILTTPIYIYNISPGNISMIGRIPDFKATGATGLTNGSVTPSLGFATHTIVNQLWIPANAGLTL